MPVAAMPVMSRLTMVDLADAGLAEDEHAGVGDQAGAQPFERVEADDLAPQHVPADRHAEGGGAGAGDEREQAAQLGGGALVLDAGGDVGGPAGAGGAPAPRRGEHCSVCVSTHQFLRGSGRHRTVQWWRGGGGVRRQECRADRRGRDVSQHGGFIACAGVDGRATGEQRPFPHVVCEVGRAGQYDNSAVDAGRCAVDEGPAGHFVRTDGDMAQVEADPVLLGVAVLAGRMKQLDGASGRAE